MSSQETIVVIAKHGEDVRERIREAAGDADVVFAESSAAAGDAITRATAIAGSARGVLSDAPSLRWVHSWAAGPDAELTPEMAASDVVLTSSVGNGAIPLAEHSMMLMLMLNRDAPRWARAQQAKTWDRFTHGELKGLTVGLFGVGHSGSDLAAKAKAFHMNVIGCRRRAEIPVDGVDEMYPMERLHDFLGKSDMVVVTAPATAETRGVFDEAAFRAMKPSAFFICISRGGIADDDALLRALEEGWIAGAGLDAHGIEPLPQESPFWSAPNTIVTPHNGATTAATAERGIDIFIENLRRFVTGEELVNVVDKAAGY